MTAVENGVPLALEVSTSFASVAEHWSRLPAPRIFLDERWVRGVEGRIGPTQRYVTVRRAAEESPVAVAAFYLVEPDAYLFFNPRALLVDNPVFAEVDELLEPEELHELLALRAAVAEAPAWGRALICAAPFGYLPSIVHDPRLGEEELRGVMRAVADAQARLAQELGASVWGVMHAPSEHPFLRALEEWRPIRFVGVAETTMDVAWRDFDEYLWSLPRKRRKEVQRELRRHGEREIEIAEAPVSEAGRAIARFQFDLQRRHGHVADLEAEEAVMASIERVWSAEAKTFVAQRAGELLGASLVYDHEGVLYPKMGGYSSAVTKEDYLDFVLTYYTTIQYAIRHGRREICFGPESYFGKAARGCRLEERWSALVPSRDDAALTRLARRVDAANRRRFALLSALSE